MGKIVWYPETGVTEHRKHCRFKNKPVSVIDEYDGIRQYPCIVLYEDETNIPVLYTGLERYVCHLAKWETQDSKTLSSKTYAVCHFLNYLLRETTVNALHECSLNIIKEFLLFLKTKENGEDYDKGTWLRYRDYVIDFLILYYTYNRDTLPFHFQWEELKVLTVVTNPSKGKKLIIAYNSSLNVTPPRQKHRKNRLLVHGYLDLLLYEAKKYAPDIALGIALGAYAGLREGEIVNLTCGRFKIIRKGFEAISSIEINLEEPAPFFLDWSKKTDPGTIKKYRIQRVYNDFVRETSELYYDQIASLESKKFNTSSNAPVFVNKQGRPMTVKTYSERVKSLFYDRFLPALKASCERQGTYADNVAYIEAYEDEYPGAHMFRHWFTMYLLTKTELTAGEIAKWRGDSNQESMNSYIHENADLISTYKESAFTLQSQILEDIERV